MGTRESKRLFERAKRVTPGGVNSPVRAFGSVGLTPRFLRRGRGCRVWDADGNCLIDYVGSWGPLVLGHADPGVLRAVRKAAERGTSFGAPTELELAMAQLVVDAVPSLELVRFVNSGTEATMSAIRLARAAAGRDRIVKFAGCYHGHSDGLLVRAGSGATTFGVPDSPGVPKAYAELTVSCEFNDLPGVHRAFDEAPESIAAVIVEPVVGNMGLVPPEPGFLKELRRITGEYGALLIFDEVMTGFRLHQGGAAALFGVTPDLYCFGKVIGGGLPVGAYAGSAQLMDRVAPVGPVYQAGTLSGNPLAMAAGMATLELLDEAAYQRLEELSARLADGLEQAGRDAGIELCVQRVGSMLTPFFQKGPVRDYTSALRSDTKRFGAFHQAMLEQGHYLPASQYEAWFVSLAHTNEAVDATVAAAVEALRVAAA
jgi:glutamate-1-semialdehyde 2,1-aminomutase